MKASHTYSRFSRDLGTSILPMQPHRGLGPEDFDVCRMNPYNSHSLPQLARKHSEQLLRCPPSWDGTRGGAVSPLCYSRPLSPLARPQHHYSPAPTTTNTVAIGNCPCTFLDACRIKTQADKRPRLRTRVCAYTTSTMRTTF